MKSLHYQLIIFFVLPILTIAQDLDVSRNLNVKGNISIDGNSGTAGQVLMSNGANAPSWVTLGSSNTLRARFAVDCITQSISNGYFDGAVGASNSQIIPLDFTNIRYNTNTDDVAIVTNGTIGVISIKKAGLYHFDVVTNYTFHSSQNQFGIGYLVMLEMNNFPAQNHKLDEKQLSPIVGTGQYESTSIVSFDIYIHAFQNLTFKAGFKRIANGTTAPSQISMHNATVRGYFISE